MEEVVSALQARICRLKAHELVPRSYPVWFGDGLDKDLITSVRYSTNRGLRSRGHKGCEAHRDRLLAGSIVQDSSAVRACVRFSRPAENASLPKDMGARKSNRCVAVALFTGGADISRLVCVQADVARSTIKLSSAHMREASRDE
jgi:hypothetical protein